MERLHYFIGQKKSPFHLSVGAVILDKQKKNVYHHHLHKVNGKTDVYLLMRNTVQPNESFERTLKRGARKEFGMNIKINRYLGSITSSFINWEKAKIQKTTLYFLCEQVGKIKNVKQYESHYGEKSVREWKPIKFLIPQMKKQAKILKRSDFDESSVLKRI